MSSSLKAAVITSIGRKLPPHGYFIISATRLDSGHVSFTAVHATHLTTSFKRTLSLDELGVLHGASLLPVTAEKLLQACSLLCDRVDISGDRLVFSKGVLPARCCFCNVDESAFDL